MQTLTCEIGILTQLDLERSGPLTITVAIGNLRQSVGMIRIIDNRQLELIYYLVSIFSVVIIFMAIVLIVIVTVFCRKVRKDRNVIRIKQTLNFEMIREGGERYAVELTLN